MQRIQVRELNQDTAGTLARVAAGETFEITNRGKLVARLIPVHGPDPEDLTDWIVDDLVTPPTVTGAIPMPHTEAPIASDAGELLSQMRDEERW